MTLMDTDETNVDSRIPGTVRLRKNSVVFGLVNFFGLVSIAGTLAAFSARQNWVADVLSQFGVQYLVLLIVATVAWAVKRSWKRLIVGVLMLIVNGWLVVPYFFLPHSSGVQQDAKVAKLRLLLLNVLRTNTEFESTLDDVLAEDADFVFLMEVSPEWKSLLKDLQHEYPHQKLICRNDYTGVAFLSKHAWDQLKIVDTNDANPPLELRFPTIDGQCSGFRLIATHPLPPFGQYLTDARDQQLQTLAQRCKSDPTSLLAGDFNLTAWSPRFYDVLQAGQLSDVNGGGKVWRLAGEKCSARVVEDPRGSVVGGSRRGVIEAFRAL